MRIEDFTFEVRDENLTRLGQILPGDLVGWESVLRFNNVGMWSIELVANLPIAQLLSTPGYGIVVTHKDAGVVLSGPTISAETTYESGDPVGVIKITGVDDSVILADRLAYPDPASADVENQTKSHDSVSFMTASTAMLWFVERNLAPGVAPASRAITGLSLATDPIAGSGISKSARFDVLGELLTEIASIDGLGFDIKQVDGTLEFRVFEPTDRSGTIRMDVANQTLSKTSFGYGAPEVTHAIVAGQGEGLNRQFLDVTTTESLNSETLFNRRIETFIDQRNTSDTVELQQAGLEKLSDGGMTQTSVDVIPSSDLTMQYGTDWNLGDRVTVVVANQEVSATVTQVSIRVESNGVFVGATVGEPNGVDFEAIVTKKQAKQQTRVNALERKEVPAIVWNDAEGTYEFVMKGGNVTQQIGAEQLAYVKNNTGSTLLNGRAVYPNGSTGTNKLVAYAQANAESTSTRTFGVLSEDIANGGHGWVTTFGMVHDIDTSALTEGAAVWLSPDVPGGLTSTKPSARTRTNIATNPRMVFTGGYPASNNATLNPMTKNVAVPATHPQGVTTCLVSQSTGTDNNALSLYGVDGLVNTGSPQRASAIWVYVNESGYEVNGGGWTQTALTANTWTFVRQQTATAAGAWSALYIRKITGNASTTVRAYATGITTESGTVAPERFFDGSSTDYVGASCSWTGTVGQSTSIAKVNEHMVLIGFCVRSHAVNGSVFVKVQNGFEFDELHDVSISNVSAGELVVRDSTNTRWENQTLAEAGVASTTDLSQGLSLKANIASPTFTGTVTSPTLNVSGVATFNNGGEGVKIRANGTTDHTYLGLYPRAASVTTRGAYLGFPANGSTQLTVANEIANGNINFITSGTGIVQENGIELANVNQLGLVPIIPSISVSSGTGSVNATTGMIYFDNCNTIYVLDSFKTIYNHYKIIVSVNTTSIACDVAFQFRASNGTLASGYAYGRHGTSTGSAVAANGSSSNTWAMMGRSSGPLGFGITMDIQNPMNSYTKRGMGSSVERDYAWGVSWYRGDSATYPGFALYPTNGGVFYGGRMQIFGYNGS